MPMILAILLLALASVMPGLAEACTKSWASPVTGAWTNAALWAPTGVPTATDDVCLSVDGTYRVTVTGSTTVRTVTIGAPGNTGAQTLAVRAAGIIGTTLTASAGITNLSVLEIQTLIGGTNNASSSVAVTSGALMNAGTLRTLPAQSTIPVLTADLVNTGAVEIGVTTTFNKAGAVYDNQGTFTIDATRTLNITSGANQTFRQSAGTLSVLGTMVLNVQAFEFNGGTVVGQPRIASGTLRYGPGAGGSGDFSLVGASTLIGDIPAGHVVRVNGGGTGGATATAPASFTNAGVLELQTLAGNTDTGASNLVVTNGILTNTGTLRTLQKSNGAGTGRIITANVVNTGAIELNESTTFNKAGGVYENHGPIGVAAGKTLSLTSGLGQVFRQHGGTLSVLGAMVFNGQTFEFNGGTVVGQALITSGTLRFGPGAGGSGDFSLRGGSTLIGDIPAGHTVRVNGVGTGATIVTAPVGFVNAGVLELQTLPGTTNNAGTTLVVTTGALTNTGTLRTIVKSATEGTGRIITANLVNTGTVQLDENTTFNKAGGVYVNQGTLAVNALRTLTIAANTQTFTTTGAITGGGRLAFSDITMFASGAAVATIDLTRVVAHIGAMGPATFDVTGTYRMISGGTLNVGLAGTAPGTGYDRLNVSGTATLLGTLAVTVASGFCPTGDFTIMTYGARVGDFATKTGLDLGNGRVLTATAGATSYVLSAPATCNTAPTIVANAGLPVLEGGVGTITPLQLRATDPEQSPAQVAFALAAAPTRGALRRGGITLGVGGTFTQADIDAGLISYLHNGSETTSDGFTFTVSDGAGGTTPATAFAIVVTPVNDAPSFARGPAQTVNEDAGAQLVVGWATAITAVEVGQVVDFLVSSDNAALFSSPPAISATGTLTYTPAPNANGVANLTVRIHDNGGIANGGADTSVPQTFTITVLAVNDAPSFTKGADEVLNEDAAPRTVSGWAGAIKTGPADEAAQTLTFAVSTDKPELFATPPAVSPAGTLTYTLTEHASGAAVVTVTLRDSGGTALGGVDTGAPQTFTITVTAVNDAPTIEEVADQEHAIGAEVSLQIVARDPEDETLTYSATNLPSGLTLDAATGQISGTLADDAAGTHDVTVTVTDQGGEGASRDFTWTVNATVSEACLIVDFREITYFRRSRVLMSSDATIRALNGIGGDFDPTVWPYARRDGRDTTRSRGTLFRLYGFAADQVGARIKNADDPSKSYPVVVDPDIPGAAYIDLDGPARVKLCVSQLQATPLEQLSPAQKNVPGLMLAHHAEVLKIPRRVRDELRALGIPLVDARGREVRRGIVDYVAIQQWGHGDADYREFVDVGIEVSTDDPSDRPKHYELGFHTVQRASSETAPGCNYQDHAPGNDGIRLNDVWEGAHVGSPNWGPPCGRREPSSNQRVREDYAVPLSAMQWLSTVNTHEDTVRVYLGEIRPAEAAGGGKHDDDDDDDDRDHGRGDDDDRDDREDDGDDDKRKDDDKRDDDKRDERGEKRGRD